MTDVRVLPFGSPVPQSKVREVVAHVASNSGNVFFTIHAEERMVQRRISRTQVLRCLMHGDAASNYPKRSEKGNWLIKLQVLSAGDVVSVVAALDRDASTGDFVVVITTYM